MSWETHSQYTLNRGLSVAEYVKTRKPRPSDALTVWGISAKFSAFETGLCKELPMTPLKEMTPAQRGRYLNRLVIPYLTGLIVLGCASALAAWSPALGTFADWTGGLLCAVSALSLTLQMMLDPPRQGDELGMLQASQSLACGAMYWRIGTYLVGRAPDWAAHLVAAAAVVALAAYLRWRRKAVRAPLPEARVVEGVPHTGGQR